MAIFSQGATGSFLWSCVWFSDLHAGRLGLLWYPVAILATLLCPSLLSWLFFASCSILPSIQFILPSIHLSILPFIHPFIHPPSHTSYFSSILPSFLHESTLPFFHPSIYPSFISSILHSFIHLSTFPSFHPSIYPSFLPFIHPLFIHPSIQSSIHPYSQHWSVFYVSGYHHADFLSSIIPESW